MDTRTYSGIAASVVIAIAVAFAVAQMHVPQQPVSTHQPISTVSYSCTAGKTIVAAYYQGDNKPAGAQGKPPIPGGSVALTLSDGRAMTLAQTISADGIRYANVDESFIFWSKGNGALVLESGQEKSYIGCIMVVSDPGGLPQIYESGSKGFSVRYPAGYVVDPNYSYQALGPGKDIAGVKFTIPETTATGTNLGADSYLSVEEIPQTPECSVALFTYPNAATSTVIESGTTYSVATSSDAGAGNRYEEVVYAMPGTNPCVAVRYFVHYGVFENYPAGTIRHFDTQSLLDQFDQIRRSLVVNQ